MKLFKLSAKRENRTAVIICLIIIIGLIIFIILGIFAFLKEASTAQASDQSGAAQSFAQYFNPKTLRVVDAIMKDRSCVQDEYYWRIWTHGFYKKYRGADGKKFKIILNWDGFWYKESGSDVIKEGDWTTLK